jgi:lipid A 4'-phosphatase
MYNKTVQDKKGCLAWIPVLIVACISPFTPFLDLWISNRFYTPSTPRGHFVDNSFTRWMFDYTELIGFITAATAFMVFLLTFVVKKWRPWRKGMLLLFFTLVLGAGAIVNGLFKEYWGRPRPKEIVEFGGKYPYRPFYKPMVLPNHKKKKSFPSGHAAVGFYYISLIVLGKRMDRKVLIYVGGACTLFFGVGVSFTRVAQGGHFFSDVLFSFLIMWEVIYVLDRILTKFPVTWEEWRRRFPNFSKRYGISRSPDALK